MAPIVVLYSLSFRIIVHLSFLIWFYRSLHADVSTNTIQTVDFLHDFVKRGMFGNDHVYIKVYMIVILFIICQIVLNT